MKFNVHQLIATMIVASFTEMNLHPDQNPLVPVIMICIPQAKICFYDCKNDLLIISETLNWIKRGKLRKLHMYVYYVMLHHSYIQRLCKEGMKTHEEHKSGVVEKHRRSQTRAYPGRCPGITDHCPSISKLPSFF